MKPLIILLGAISFSALAAGPTKIASFDRNLWPEKIDNVSTFDRASQFEIANFLTAMNEIKLDSDTDIRSFTGLKKVNAASVQKWLVMTRKQLSLSLLASCSSSPTLNTCKNAHTAEQITDNIRTAYLALDTHYQAWKQASLDFDRRYLYEQVRLAALFPRITSEIMKLDPSEVSGFEMPDKSFMFSFDDGPSQGSSSQNMIKQLNKMKWHAMFFVLGERLETLTKAQAQALYQGHCVASHGYLHKPHSKYQQWQYSIDKTQALIDEKLGTKKSGNWFRPPYGQRSEEIIKHLNQDSAKVMLWNIDSQDWNRKLTEPVIYNRVVTLMLLWRKGVILFHDLYEKDIEVLNKLGTFSQKAELNIVDCSDI